MVEQLARHLSEEICDPRSTLTKCSARKGGFRRVCAIVDVDLLDSPGILDSDLELRRMVLENEEMWEESGSGVFVAPRGASGNTPHLGGTLPGPLSSF
jgi:hypothetical protein